MQVVLVRHGETEWSRSGRHTGRSDVALTAAGLEQADRVGAALAGAGFATVLCSPLKRARDTCARAGFARSALECGELAEWDYGDYEGRTTDEISADVPDWTVWTHPMLGGESVEEVGTRADVVIARLRASEGPALVFAHGHLLRILAARWVGLAASAGRYFLLDTAAISHLGQERSTPAIARWNDTGHLGLSPSAAATRPG